MVTMQDPATLLLPVGTRLVHIGPPKTGTTSLQSAFHACRRDAATQGVHYAGPRSSPMGAARSVAGLVNPATGRPSPPQAWQDLVGEVRRASEPRTLISSEYLSRAGEDAIRTVVADLGADRVHIVATLRPLAKIMPSQWQQGVRNGATASYDAWLRAIFDKPSSKAAQSFWLRHRHDALIARWAAVAGPERVTVVILDDEDQAMVLRVFERLLGLTDGTLTADRDLSNRSLNLAEIEFLRGFNARFSAARLPRSLYHQVVTRGAAFHMRARTPGPDEPRIVTPAWALERALATADEMVTALTGSGVRIVGDPSRLTIAPRGRDDDLMVAGHVVPLDIAVTGAMGVLIGSGITGLDPIKGIESEEGDGGSEAVELESASTSQLLGALTRRGRSAATRGVRAAGRRVARARTRAE